MHARVLMIEATTNLLDVSLLVKIVQQHLGHILVI